MKHEYHLLQGEIDEVFHFFIFLRSYKEDQCTMGDNWTMGGNWIKVRAFKVEEVKECMTLLAALEETLK